MKRINSQKGFVVPLIIAIVVLIAAGGVYWGWKKSSNELHTANECHGQVCTNMNASSTAQVESVSTTDWKIYTNKKSGRNFTLMYPLIWQAEEGSDHQWSIRFTNTTQHPKPDSDDPRDVIIITADAEPCIASSWSTGFGLALYKKECVGHISIGMTALDKQSQILEEKILSTFKFTSTTSQSTSDWKTNTNESGDWKIYSNPEYGITFMYSSTSKIQDDDITGGRALYFNANGTSVTVFIRSQQYGPNGTLVPAQCTDAQDMNKPPIAILLNGVNFLVTDVSGAFGGMESAAYAESYCTVHNGTVYSVTPQIGYGKYDQIKPDKATSFEKIDQVVKDMKFTFTY